MRFRGDRLTGIREFKGLRRGELARLAAMDRAGIQHLEEGVTKNPRWETVETLSEKLDVTNDYLGGDGPDLPFARAAVLQALERFKRTEGQRFEPFDHTALARAAEDPDAPHTVAGWRAFISMSARAWPSSRIQKASNARVTISKLRATDRARPLKAPLTTRPLPNRSRRKS